MARRDSDRYIRSNERGIARRIAVCMSRKEPVMAKGGGSGGGAKGGGGGAKGGGGKGGGGKGPGGWPSMNPGKDSGGGRTNAPAGGGKK